jgi:hypothetical protein
MYLCRWRKIFTYSYWWSHSTPIDPLEAYNIYTYIQHPYMQYMYIQAYNLYIHTYIQSMHIYWLAAYSHEQLVATCCNIKIAPWIRFIMYIFPCLIGIYMYICINVHLHTCTYTYIITHPYIHIYTHTHRHRDHGGWLPRGLLVPKRQHPWRR